VTKQDETTKITNVIASAAAAARNAVTKQALSL